MQPSPPCSMMAFLAPGKQEVMSLWNSLAERLGNPLDWRSAHKSLFVLAIVWLLVFGYAAWAGIVLSWPFGPESVRVNHVAPYLPWLLLMLGLTTLLVLTTWLAGRFNEDSPWHQHFCAQWYTVILIVLAHFTGIFSLATGVILSGAPVVGFMFLNRSAVFGAMATALVTHVLLSVGATEGMFPYGPMIGPSLDADGSLDAFWVTSLYIFTAPQYAVLVALSWYILTRWRQREAEVRLLSMTDALTGVANRRAIMALLRRELEKSRETGLPVSVVMADLDHFKQLNDSRGHQAGDAVLTQAGAVFKQALRQSDHVGRYGGEEFLIVLAGADSHGASLLAERCRVALEALSVEAPDNGAPLTVTASFGLCSNEEAPDMTMEDILRAADEALYLAKDRGRNRLEMASPV